MTQWAKHLLSVVHKCENQSFLAPQNTCRCWVHREFQKWNFSTWKAEIGISQSKMPGLTSPGIQLWVREWIMGRVTKEDI